MTSADVSGRRLVSIDVLRGIAALAVALFHAARHRPYIGAPSLLGRAAASVLSYGCTGVMLFFVVSGFCIHLRFAQQTAAGETAAVDFLGFWRRRFRRLYPAYLTSLALYVVVQLGNHELKPGAFLVLDLGLHAAMLHNLLWATTYTLNGVFWTLAVEEQLYLAYFVLLRLRRRFSWPGILMIALGVRLAWFGLSMLVHARFGVMVAATESAAGSWFCWILGAVAVEAAVGLVRLPRAFRHWATLLLTLAAILALDHVDRTANYGGTIHDVIWFLVQPMWGLVFFVVVNVAVRAEPQLGRSRTGLLLAHIGLFSYSLYLTHELVLTHLLHWMAQRLGWSVDAQTVVSVLVLVPVCVGLARGFFVVCERPFLNRVGRAGPATLSAVPPRVTAMTVR